MRYDDLQLMGKALYHWKKQNTSSSRDVAYDIGVLPGDKVNIAVSAKLITAGEDGNQEVVIPAQFFTTSSHAFMSMKFEEENQRLIDFLNAFNKTLYTGDSSLHVVANPAFTGVE